MSARLDHLAVGAASLEQGVGYIREHLGVDIPRGGEHPLMGTHNHLMRLSGDTFLEVIAVNPDAPTPDRPRWFGLDDPAVHASLEQCPRLLTWVVNTPDLVRLGAKTSFSFGEPVSVSRGDLNWHFGLPDDGRLLASGTLPYLIQWHTETHPANRMADLGCTLRQLELYHPQTDWLASVLADIEANGLVKLAPLAADSAPFLVAHIDTPTGLKTLSSRPPGT